MSKLTEEQEAQIQTKIQQTLAADRETRLHQSYTLTDEERVNLTPELKASIAVDCTNAYFRKHEINDAVKKLNPNTSKQGKIALADIHPGFIDSLARVNTVSKLKGYEQGNWIRDDVKCYFSAYLASAALRHIYKFLAGEDYNVEQTLTGDPIITPDVLHVEAAAYNLLMLARLYRQGRLDLDDRKFKGAV